MTLGEESSTTMCAVHLTHAYGALPCDGMTSALRDLVWTSTHRCGASKCWHDITSHLQPSCTGCQYGKAADSETHVLVLHDNDRDSAQVH